MNAIDIIKQNRGRVTISYLDNGLAVIIVDGHTKKIVNSSYLDKLLKENGLKRLRSKTKQRKKRGSSKE